MKGQRNKGRKGKKRTEGAESRVEFGGAKSVVCVRETSSRCLAAEGRSDVHLQFKCSHRGARAVWNLVHSILPKIMASVPTQSNLEPNAPQTAPTNSLGHC